MAKIREELSLVDKFSKVFSKYVDLAEKASKKTQAAQKSIKSFESAAKNAGSGVSGLTNAVRNLAGAYLSLQGLRNVLNLSDTISQTTSRIDMMNDGLQTTEELTNMIYAAAQRSRASYTGMADMVGKLGNLAGNAFNSSQELVAFAEQLNKQIALSGASAASADAAILQLTQGLSSGALRGEELNSVLEQTPMVAKTIADYLGMTTGEMRELASEGSLTAEVVKNALLSAAEETNAKFEQLPMTFSQTMNQLKNYAIQAFQPVLQQISDFINSPAFEQIKVQLASTINAVASFASQALTLIGNLIAWISENWSVIQPILAGVVAGFIAWKVATLAIAAAQAVLNLVLYASPLTWIVMAIVAIVAAIAYWISAIGGLQVAWLIVVDAVMTAWDYLVLGFWTGVFWVMNLLDSMALAFQQVGAAVANYVDTMRANVLTIIQNMVNGAIDLINFFIEQLNKLPGVSIEAIAHTTFGAEAQAEAAANAASRSAAISSKKASNEASAADRAAQLQSMLSELQANHASRQQEIQALQHASQSGGNESLLDSLTGGGEYAMPTGGLGGIGGSGGLGGAVGDIGGSVGGSLGSDVSDIKKEVAMSEEDLKSLVDMAERQYVNNINLTAQTPVITVNGQNTGNNAEDRKALANALRDILLEQSASASIRSTARVV